MTRRRRAFSLLELMVSMAMMAIVALSLYSSLSIAFKAKDSAAAAVAPVRTALIASELIRQDLESVPPPTGILAGGFFGYTQAIDQSRRNDNLSFCCIGSEGLADDRLFSEGTRRVELTLDTSEDPPVLVRRVTRNLLSPSQNDPDEEILCRGVRSLSFRYYDGSVWSDEWDSTTVGDVLPAAVEVAMEVDLPRRRGDTSDQPPVYRVTRIFPLACAKPVDTTGSGATTGSTGSTGGTP